MHIIKQEPRTIHTISDCSSNGRMLSLRFLYVESQQMDKHNRLKYTSSDFSCKLWLKKWNSFSVSDKCCNNTFYSVLTVNCGGLVQWQRYWSDQQSCSTPGVVSTGMGDRIGAQLPMLEIYLSLTNHPGQFSLAIPLWQVQ